VEGWEAAEVGLAEGVRHELHELALRNQMKRITRMGVAARERRERKKLLRGCVGEEIGGDLEESVASGCADGLLAALVYGGKEQRHEIGVSDVGLEIDDDGVLDPPSVVLINGIRPGVQKWREGLVAKPAESVNCHRVVFEEPGQFRNRYLCVGPKGREREDCRVRSLCLGHDPKESVYRIYYAVGCPWEPRWPSWRVVCRPPAKERDSVCTDCPDCIPRVIVIRTIHGLGFISGYPVGKWAAFVRGFSGAGEEICKPGACSNQQEQAHRLRPHPHAPVWTGGVE